jgi:hypothetical protein
MSIEANGQSEMGMESNGGSSSESPEAIPSFLNHMIEEIGNLRGGGFQNLSGVSQGVQDQLKAHFQVVPMSQEEAQALYPKSTGISSELWFRTNEPNLYIITSRTGESSFFRKPSPEQ